MHPTVRRFVHTITRNPAVTALLFLDFIGFLLFLKSGPSAAGFLGFITLVALTMSYFFLKGTLLGELEQHIIDIEAHPGGYENMMNDLVRVSQAVMRLDEIAGELADLKEGVAEIRAIKEGLSALKQDIATCVAMEEDVSKLSEIVSKLSGVGSEVVKLRQAVSGIKTPPARRMTARKGSSGNVQELEDEIADLKDKVEALMAGQPDLKIVLHKTKLLSQVDRTLIECSLSVENLSNKPNEIAAVRVELDSGRDRMTPTSIRHWMPEGTEASEERRVILPMKVLEKSTSGKIDLAATGWPLEKTQTSYPLRITLKDKDGNEFSTTTKLKPEKA